MSKRVFALVILLSVLGLHFIQSSQVASQTNQSSDLEKVIQDVLKAESAGAQPKELGTLADQLDSVLSLEVQLKNLSPQDSNTRAQLDGRISQTLAAVDNQAVQLESTASHRMFTYRLVSYSVGALAAILVTITLHYSMSLRRRCRIKSVLRSKIVPR